MRITLFVLGIALLSLATDAQGQGKSFGFGLEGSMLLSSSELDVADIPLYGARMTFSPHPWAQVALRFQGTLRTEEVQAIRRPFHLFAPAIDIEGTLLGNDNRLFAVVSPSLLIFNLGAAGATADEHVTIPAMGAGIGLSANLFGPVHAEFLAMDLMTWARPETLHSTPYGDRSFGHSPQLVARASIKLRKQERIARFEDLPLNTAHNFQPVRAAATQSTTLRETGGRAHEHVTDAIERDTEFPRSLRTTEYDALLGAIYFSAGGYSVPSDYQSVVREVAEFMRTNPSVKITIRGYTSPDGNSRYNQVLAQQRASAVREQLITYYDIHDQRVTAVVGGDDPENSEEIARRVEIRTTAEVVR